MLTRNLPAGPTPPDERLRSIDIVRGLALFGVLTVNLVTEFRVSIFEQFVAQPQSANLIDRLAKGFVALMLESKAFVLFSFLFGVSLAIQHERFAALEHPRRRLIRRLAVLLAFGLAHALLLWNGDIL